MVIYIFVFRLNYTPVTVPILFQSNHAPVTYSGFETQGNTSSNYNQWRNAYMQRQLSLSRRIIFNLQVQIDPIFSLSIITNHPFKLGSSNLYPVCKTSRLRFLLFWRRFTSTSTAKFNLNIQISLWLVSPLYNNHGCIDCSVPIVSQSPSSAWTYIPRRLHGLDCFSVNYLHVYWSTQARIFGR